MGALRFIPGSRWVGLEEAPGERFEQSANGADREEEMSRGKYATRGLAGALVLIAACVLVLGFPAQLVSAKPEKGNIAHGGGTTIVQGGTGSPGFVPVLTTLAFHAEKSGNTITGGLECLARAPAVATGPTSAQFTVNVMYVTGHITGAVVNGDTATLTGTAQMTGLGAGSGAPFEFVVHKGGPGSTAVLTTRGSLVLVFNEILLEGSFEVSSGDTD